MKKAHDEAFAEKEKPFEERVDDSYRNKGLLEFDGATEDANKLDKTFDELMSMSEETLEELYGANITDLAVAMGVKKQQEDTKKI